MATVSDMDGRPNSLTTGPTGRLCQLVSEGSVLCCIVPADEGRLGGGRQERTGGLTVRGTGALTLICSAGDDGRHRSTH